MINITMIKLGLFIEISEIFIFYFFSCRQQALGHRQSTYSLQAKTELLNNSDRCLIKDIDLAGYNNLVTFFQTTQNLHIITKITPRDNFSSYRLSITIDKHFIVTNTTYKSTPGSYQYGTRLATEVGCTVHAGT